jgi:hypothetical protein
MAFYYLGWGVPGSPKGWNGIATAEIWAPPTSAGQTRKTFYHVGVVLIWCFEMDVARLDWVN